MISSWAAWLLTIGAAAVLGVGLYLLAWHRGYLAGVGDRLAQIPAEPWAPPSESEFFAELLERERLNGRPETHRER